MFAGDFLPFRCVTLASCSLKRVKFEFIEHNIEHNMEPLCECCLLRHVPCVCVCAVSLDYGLEIKNDGMQEVT